jgi:hypothetical protein
MDKKTIIALLESKKPQGIKISDKITKADLIKSLTEAYDLPSVIDVEKQLREGKVPSLGTVPEDDKTSKKTSISAIKVPFKTPQEDKPETPAPTEEKKPEKKHIKFVPNLGRRAIVFDDSLIEIDDQGKQAISDMFSEDEIKKILETQDLSKWKKLKRDPIFCVKTHVDKNFKKIRCFNGKIVQEGGNPFTFYPLGQYLLTNYKRADDRKEVVHLDDPLFKKYKKDEDFQTTYIPMEQTHPDEEIAILPVSVNKYAIVTQWSKNEEPFLFKIYPTEIKYFYSEVT